MLKNFFNHKSSKYIIITVAILLSFWIPFIALPPLIIYLIYLAVKADKKKKAEENRKKMMWSFEGQLERPKDIIQESITLISKTEHVETAIGRFDTIKSMAELIFSMAPANHAIQMTMDFSALLQNQNDSNIPASLAMNIAVVPVTQEIVEVKNSLLKNIDHVKDIWLLNFFTKQIQKELDKASMVTEPKLKKKIFKKALDVSLKASEYLPNHHDEIKKFIAIIEKQTV